jgi:membrane protease YdiL (CAAX protease family)
LAAAALLLWFTLLRPNVADLVAQFLPPVAPIWILTGGVLFAAVNAAVEEGAYRGVVMWALEAQVGPLAALLMQAAAFGTLHIHGFPRGPVGVVLACIYGLMMGGIRLRCGGLLAPWAAHVGVDVVIVAILLGLAR